MLIEQRDTLRGEITVPGDKSISHRAILFSSLAKGTSEIDGLLMGEDCLCTIDCFRKMNVSIEILPNKRIKVHGNGLFALKPPSGALNSGRSGTAIRLLLGVLSGQPFSSTLTRDESALRKPIGKVVRTLREMGATINGREDGNICPLSISSSKLKGKEFELSMMDSSIKSPIIIAGMYAEGETKIKEQIKSREHSELMLNYLGADIKVDGNTVTSKMVENLFAQHIEIPGDISIAAYFITAGILVPNSDITIKNVGINETRSGILKVYKAMGANIELLNERLVSNEKVADIRVRSSSLTATTIESEMIPTLIDEVPVIALAATLAKGRTEIKGLKDFKIKESKTKEITLELSKLGANVTESEESLTIEGVGALRGTVVEGYNDHMITMTLCVAALVAEGETTIRKTQILDIFYPDFVQELNGL